jgi:hypothetical protein
MSTAPHNLQWSERAVRREPTATAAAVIESPQFRSADVSQHRAIYELLRTTYPAYSLEEFAAWLEAPNYDPADRILLCLGSELIGHALVVMRYANFAGVRLPIALIRELAVRCEFDCQFLQSELLARAEQAAAHRGAVIALLAGREIAEQPCDQWHPLPSQGYSAADPQEVLSKLGEASGTSRGADRTARVGLWRRMDLDGLMSIYAVDSIRKWGTIARNESCWQWLLGRDTHDAILVVTAELTRNRNLTLHPPLAGYAIAKRNHVLEVASTDDNCGERLLARLCRDAVERGDHTLTLHTPVDDPLQQILFSAGGDWCHAARDGIRPVWCRLLDRTRWVEALFPFWHERAREQRLTPPCTLTIELPDRRCELLLSRRSAHWYDDGNVETPADIECDPSTLAALLVGHENWQDACEAERLTVLRPQSIPLLSALFSQRVWHFSLLDWL